VKPGPYIQAVDKEFAPWAPREGDRAALPILEALLCDLLAAFVALAALAPVLRTRPPAARPARRLADGRHDPQRALRPEDKLFATYQILPSTRGRHEAHDQRQAFTEGQLALFNSAPQITRYAVDKTGMLVLSSPSWDARSVSLPACGQG